jgi:hypothetical protein
MLCACDKSIHHLYRGLEAGCQNLGLTPSEDIRQILYQGKPVTQLFCRLLGFPPSTCYAQKTVAFHFELGSEFVTYARYEMRTLEQSKDRN